MLPKRNITGLKLHNSRMGKQASTTIFLPLSPTKKPCYAAIDCWNRDLDSIGTDQPI